MAHVAVETLPKTRVLSQGSITATRHIAKDSIVLEVLTLAALLEIREKSCIVISDVKGW